MNSFIRLIVLPVLLALCYPQIALSGEACETAEVTVREKATSLVIDTVWSGTRVGFSGLSERGRILVTYYDQDRYLTVAEFKPDLKRLCRHRLPSRFSGWDSHNYTTVAACAGRHSSRCGKHACQPAGVRANRFIRLAQFARAPAHGWQG